MRRDDAHPGQVRRDGANPAVWALGRNKASSMDHDQCGLRCKSMVWCAHPAMWMPVLSGRCIGETSKIKTRSDATQAGVKVLHTATSLQSSGSTSSSSHSDSNAPGIHTKSKQLTGTRFAPIVYVLTPRMSCTLFGNCCSPQLQPRPLHSYENAGMPDIQSCWPCWACPRGCYLHKHTPYPSPRQALQPGVHWESTMRQ